MIMIAKDSGAVLGFIDLDVGANGSEKEERRDRSFSIFLRS